MWTVGRHKQLEFNTKSVSKFNSMYVKKNTPSRRENNKLPQKDLKSITVSFTEKDFHRVSLKRR